ncbi:unnamed protein product [Amoebophrya sp. A120]|nr:unnamed protein product [Amoebophrya sp. A120]|eukprot:GSA120T00000904001.1
MSFTPEPDLRERFEACLLLHAVGDAMGYRGGQWEFCASTTKIRNDCEELGGVLEMDLTNWMVSDDTVEHLAMAEGLSLGLSKLSTQMKQTLLQGVVTQEVILTSGAGPGPASTSVKVSENLLDKIHSSKEKSQSSTSATSAAKNKPLSKEPPNTTVATYDQLLQGIAVGFKKAGNDFTGRAPGKGEQQCIKLLTENGHNWDAKPFDSRSGGCGACMRTSVFGFPRSFQTMLTLSLEASRMSKTVPVGFLAGFTASYFTWLALYEPEIQPAQWAEKLLLEGLPAVEEYLKNQSGPRPRHLRDLEAGGFFPLIETEFGQKWLWYAKDCRKIYFMGSTGGGASRGESGRVQQPSKATAGRAGSSTDSCTPGVATTGEPTTRNSCTGASTEDGNKKFWPIPRVEGAGARPVLFQPGEHEVAAMDTLYMKIAQTSMNKTGKFPGSCGTSAVLIAYDALVHALYYDRDGDTQKTMEAGPSGASSAATNIKISLKQTLGQHRQRYKTLVERAVLHRGDNDSTGSIALSWYGALFGFQGVPEKHYSGIEYSGRCRNAAKKLFSQVQQSSTSTTTGTKEQERPS